MNLFPFLFADGEAFLLASSLAGQYWKGSVWYYSQPSQAPVISDSALKFHLKQGAADMLLISPHKLVLGTDTGLLSS